jgi:hypothetical protein
VTHPNRNWKRRWEVNLAARTAKHVDGWLFQFATEPDAGGPIDGKCVAHPSLFGYDLKKLPQTAARIAREAGEIYMEKIRVRKNDDQHD